MADRFTLLYRFYDSDNNAWVDLTPQVDSRQTSITQNLCSTAFKSAKDEATFVMPETPLFEPDGTTPTPKKKLIDKIMGSGDILVQINAPGSVDVLWVNEDVLWNGEHVQWRGSVRYFTGYVDRSSFSLRSYPLPPRLEVKLQDVSTLRLDDKVDYHITMMDDPDGTRLKISTIVSTLLGYAGYTDIGSTALDPGDDEILEAFVIDKDNAKTYRQYIDDLLFEAGGYVLDFNEYGQANVVHLKWDGTEAASRTIDNPLNANGISMKSAYLKEDGVSVKWSSLAWTGPGKLIYNQNIQRSVDDDGNMTGVSVPMNTYWPDGGETAPNYFQYQEERLDLSYFQNATKFKNDDISMIMAKDVYARIDALRNGQVFDPSMWGYVNPTAWPAGDNWNDKYGIPTNPCHWPKKAWYLLFNPQWAKVTPDGSENPKSLGWFTESGGVYTKTNDTTVVPGKTYYLGATYTAVTDPDHLLIPVQLHWYEQSGGIYTPSDDIVRDMDKTYYEATGGDVQILLFMLYGNVLYKDKINSVDMADSKNPKEYQSTYIYNQSHAERFAQFWWHFLQTSRYQFSWSEPNRRSPLNDVVAVGVKGNNSTQKALIAGKTHTWINDNVEIISYTAVGIDTYTPASLVPISVLPSSTKEQKQTTTGAKTATFSTTPSYNLAQWENFVNVLSTWTITNSSSFNVGDTAIINGTISDMDNLPIKLYLSVSEVDSPNISGTGIEIRYIPIVENWDFDIEQTSAVRNDRLVWDPLDANSYTDIHLTSKQSGIGVLEHWECTGTRSLDDQVWYTQFVGTGSKTATGDSPVLRIYKQESLSEISVTMKSSDNTYSVTKKITIVNETEYDHDFGAFVPYVADGQVHLYPEGYTDHSFPPVSYDIIAGDFYVLGKNYATENMDSSVQPTSDPKAEGYYEKQGAYALYIATDDTTVVPGKTYYRATNQSDVVPNGVPVIYRGPYSGWGVMSASTENAQRMLSCLGNVLSNPDIQPSTSALYAWFENLVAKNAVIENLHANQALFNSIHVTGDSIFDGNIDSDALTTESKSNITTISLDTGSSTMACQGKGKYEGQTFNYYCIAQSSINLDDGQYVLTTGTYTYNGTAYSLSESHPVTIKVSDNRSYLSISSADPYIPSVTYRTFSNKLEAPSGYLAGSNYRMILSSALADSKGNVFTHDLIPKDTVVDSVGTHNLPYNDGHFNSLEILTPGGLTYTHGSPSNMGSEGISGNHGNAISNFNVLGDINDYTYIFISGIIWNLNDSDGIHFSTPLIPIKAISTMLGVYSSGDDYEFYYVNIPDYESSTTYSFSTAIGFAFNSDRTKVYVKPHLRRKTSPSTVYQSYDVTLYGIK